MRAQRGPVVDDISKKNFKGTISVLNKDRKRIHLKGKIRINGDIKDNEVYDGTIITFIKQKNLI